jgi:hypothetical protein
MLISLAVFLWFSNLNIVNDGDTSSLGHTSGWSMMENHLLSQDCFL